VLPVEEGQKLVRCGLFPFVARDSSTGVLDRGGTDRGVDGMWGFVFIPLQWFVNGGRREGERGKERRRLRTQYVRYYVEGEPERKRGENERGGRSQRKTMARNIKVDRIAASHE